MPKTKVLSMSIVKVSIITPDLDNHQSVLQILYYGVPCRVEVQDIIQLPWLRYFDAYLSSNAFIPPIIYLCPDFIATIIHIPETEESGGCHFTQVHSVCLRTNLNHVPITTSAEVPT